MDEVVKKDKSLSECLNDYNKTEASEKNKLMEYIYYYIKEIIEICNKLKKN